ncbi:MAG: hemolysin family protein [Gemmatimonadota bacterium]
MTVDIAVRLAAGAVLVLVNAFFVTTEFALTRIRQLPAKDFEGSRNLRRAWEMTERLEIYLTGCQLGISISSILLGVIAEPAFTALLEPWLGALDWSAGTRHVVAITLAVVLMNLIHKIWGEQAPTYLGVERPREVARYLAPALYWWTKVMYPVIIVGDGLAKWTLSLFGVEITRSWTRDGEARSAEEAGDVDEPAPEGGRFAVRQQMLRLLGRVEGLPVDRRDEIMAALDIGDRPVREIVVPRDRIVALRPDDTADRVRRIVAEYPHTRFPLVGDALEDFRGIIYIPALLARFDELRAGTTRLADLAAEPLTLPANVSIAEAIDRFQAAHQELALVFEGDGVVGLVTTTDAFEAIAGELEDPLDVG